MRHMLTLFFTMDVSLQEWSMAGLVERDTQLYHMLYEHGWDIQFLTYGQHDDADFLPADSPIRVLSRPNGMDRIQYKKELFKIHRAALQKSDVIKSHQVHGARFAATTAWRLGKPYMARCGYLPSYFLAHEPTSQRQRLVNWLEEFYTFHRADVVCVPSQSEIDYLQQRYRINRQKAQACPNWIDTDFFKPDPSIKKNPRQICFIGRFQPQKAPLTLIEAVKDMPDIELLMIGNGKLEDEIRAKIAAYNINATILGRTPNEELPRYLNSSAIYVLPTLYEGGSPKTLLEAMACGLPVVSTDTFGTTEAFIDQEHGYKCQAKDVAGIRRAILQLLENPTQAQKFGEQGRQHVINIFSAEQALKRELAILDRLK